jgi:type I restriction enzyme, S subunit
MSQWETVALRDVAVVYDGPHATPAKTDEGAWYLSISSLNNGRFDFVRSAHLSEVDLPRWTKRVAPQSGDTLFSYETRLGEAAYWEHDVEAALGRRMGLLRPKAGKVEPRYLSYAYLGPQFQEVVRQKTLHGATVDRIPVGDMPSWPLLLPPLAVQRAILRILGSIDRLIENNRRRMEVLEEMARAIYREWFVRFRFPGHEHTPIISGDVPCGWQRRTLAQCVAFRSGGTPNKAVREYWDGKIPWVSSGEMTQTRLYDTPLRITREAAEAGSRLVRRGTILIVVRGMSLAKEFRIATVAREMAFNQDLKALECKEDVEPGFLFHYLLDQRDRIRELATEASHGTKKLETAVLERLPVVVPDGRLQRHFSDFVRDFTGHRDVLHRQNERLTAARDLLLPRLMSGEITV